LTQGTELFINGKLFWPIEEFAGISELSESTLRVYHGRYKIGELHWNKLFFNEVDLIFLKSQLKKKGWPKGCQKRKVKK
jgi:hypothetical protein